MSLHDLEICNKVGGGCGHARRRHIKVPGSSWATLTGGCKTVGSDGPCSCMKFREETKEVKI